MGLTYTTTKDIEVPSKLVEQVIGQDNAVNVIRKAALQRRHVLLIGEPGTGKSMLGVALSELLGKEDLVDIVSFPNPNDENVPLIRTMKSDKARELVNRGRVENMNMFKNQNILMLIIAIVAMIAPWWVLNHYTQELGAAAGAIMFAAFFLGGTLFLVSFIMFLNLGKRMQGKNQVPKIVVDNYNKKKAPFMDATGAHAGALLGDVLHDPFQSGGLGTPAHERVVAGMIHKTHKGVLFIDEISTLALSTQQELLSAIQEKQYSITGQSERSAGAMVRTEPVPCDFILVAAGNLETVKNLHPALRSRIRGYGYEVFMDETFPDTVDNRDRIAIFIAQEIKKDHGMQKEKKIPHFSKDAVESIIEEARRRANRKDHLTLRFRELGGLVRAAGDIALDQKAKLVKPEHVKEAAKTIARSLEKQMADKYIEHKKEYEVIKTSGKIIGRVNGLAVIGSGSGTSGILLPIEAEVTQGNQKTQINATGKLGDIAKEAVTNVSAIVKKLFGEDLKDGKDIFVQFLQTYEGVEGDSASIAVATSIISALKQVPIKQDFAMTGSLSVRGDVLPIGGVSSKIEAAIETGVKNIIVPESNMKDIVIDQKLLKTVKVIPVKHVKEVLENALDWKGKTSILNAIKKVK
ncbi:MAG: ATP-dependent protease LonB [Nanoarchaeota archaeon]